VHHCRKSSSSASSVSFARIRTTTGLESWDSLRRSRWSSSAKVRTAPEAVAIALLDKTTRLPQGYAALDKQSGGVLAAMIARGEFSAARGAVTCVYPAHAAAKSKSPARYYILGLGDKAKFTPEAIDAAVKLTSRYLTARFLPDKAIDVLDEAGARGRIGTMTRPPAIKHLEAEIERINRELKILPPPDDHLH